MRVIHEQGDYRIVEIADDYFDADDLKGDTYCPRANPDIDPETLRREEREFKELVNREGVFGYVLERWNPETGKGWEHVDSCWGFIGQYTPGEEIFNHYIVAEMIGMIETYTYEQDAMQALVDVSAAAGLYQDD